MKLEICCYSIEDIKIAYKNGADRIEFCAGRSDGGLTPSYGDLQQASQLNLPIPIHPIIRPRGGDFYYNQAEINSMIDDITLVRELKFAGVVFGCLVPSGLIDLTNLKKLINAAEGLTITFHRAFDVCDKPFLALQQLNDYGIHRLLTSGQQQNALKGIHLIERLHEQTQSTIIMPGSGIRAENLDQFIELGLSEFHSSATQSTPSPMQYKNLNVNMSHTKNDEFLRYIVDAVEIQKMKKLLSDRLNAKS